MCQCVSGFVTAVKAVFSVAKFKSIHVFEDNFGGGYQMVLKVESDVSRLWFS